MPGLKPTLRFEKSLKSVDPQTRKAAAKAMGLFIENPRHPSLAFEKYHHNDVCTIRVNNNWRIILQDAGDGMYDIIDILDHDKAVRRYGTRKR